MPIHIPPALHYRRFRLLWMGLAVSIAGSQMQIWGLLWHIRSLTDQPIALGGIGLARILPVIVFSLIGGAVADTANRRRILFFTQTIMAGTAVVLGWLSIRQEITLWHIYLLTAIQAIAISFDLPARQALVPNLVPAQDLPSAFSMQSIAFQVGSIVGPALSGLVIAYMGQPYIYLINAISFLAVIFALLAIGPVPQQVQPGSLPNGTRRVSLSAIREGIGFITSQPIILSTMILDFLATFFSSANTLMPIFARDVLHVGALEYGRLSAAQAVGAVIAALVLSQMREIHHQGPVFLLSVVAFGLATIIFGLARLLLLSFLALMAVGAADSVSVIIRNTIRQLQTPDFLRGRMTSINQIFFMGGPQLGEIEAGVVGQLFGAPLAVITGGIGCILSVAWIARRWPQLRTYDGTEPHLVKAGVG